MNGLSKYKKRVFACLTCTREEKEYCFSRIAESLGENTDCSFEELVERFGEPETVAASFLDNLPAENNMSAISTERRNSARFKKIVFIVIAMIVFIIVFFCFWDAKTRGGDSVIDGPTIISSWEDANNTKGEN
jgi:hypothetical protein